MKLSNHKSGPGAAHIGFSMFGARGPLREEEGAGGSSAAPVAPPPAAPGEPAPAPGAPAEKLLPQSQVSTLIAEAKRETEAKTRARVLQEIEAAKAPPPAPKPAAKSDGSMSAADVQALLARDRAFTRATATANLNDRQLARMEAALNADNPSDVAAWSAAYIEDLGLAKLVTQPVAAIAAEPIKPAPATTPPAPATNISDKGPASSGGSRDSQGIYDTRPQDATRDDFERIATVMGREKALQFAADRINAYLRTVKLVPENRRPR